MIYDKLSNILRYKGLHPNLDLALEYIASNLDDMPQHIQLQGSEVYGNQFAYETVPDSESFFEAHRLYADIQILRSGRERIAVTDISRLEETQAKPENDFWAYHGPEDCSMNMDADSFMIVLPGDGHKLKMQIDGPQAVAKAVFKVKVK